MQIQTKYNIGNTLWVLNRYTALPIEVKIYRIVVDYYLDCAHVNYYCTDGTDGGKNYPYVLDEFYEDITWWNLSSLIQKAIQKTKAVKLQEDCGKKPDPKIVRKKSTLEDEFAKFFSELNPDYDEIRYAPHYSAQNFHRNMKARKPGDELSNLADQL